MTEAIRGFWVASATPLAADGSVDSAKLAGHAKQLFGKGVDGVVLFGTTGEGTSFNVAERIATLGGSPVGTPGALVAARSWEDYSIGRDDARAARAASSPLRGASSRARNCSRLAFPEILAPWTATATRNGHAGRSSRA